jgi:hypothetical protein
VKQSVHVKSVDGSFGLTLTGCVEGSVQEPPDCRWRAATTHAASTASKQISLQCKELDKQSFVYCGYTRCQSSIEVHHCQLYSCDFACGCTFISMLPIVFGTFSAPDLPGCAILAGFPCASFLLSIFFHVHCRNV